MNMHPCFNSLLLFLAEVNNIKQVLPGLENSEISNALLLNDGMLKRRLIFFWIKMASIIKMFGNVL